MSIELKTKNNILAVLIGVLLISVSILIFGLVYENNLPKIVEEINNSSIGAILTAIITVFLLSQQSQSEEIKDRNSKIFEKKLEIYGHFMEELQEFIINLNTLDDSSSHGKSVKKLIFQLAEIKMHTHSSSITMVFNHINNIYDVIGNGSSDENNNDVKYYNEITKILFDIVKVFQQELYGKNLGEDDHVNLEIISQKIISNASNISTKDLTKYLYKETKYGKSRLVLAIVKDYVNSHQGIGFDELRKVFPNRIQGSMNVFTTLDESKKIKGIRHFQNTDDVIHLSDSSIAVCNQWGLKNITAFINHVRELGYDVQSVK